MYVGSSSHISMVRHRALCVKVSDAPGVLDFSAVLNPPAFGAEYS